MNTFNTLSSISKNENSERKLAIYEVKKGGFGETDKEGVNTFLCTSKVNKLVSNIETFEKIIEDENWPVSQIIQREIDRDRIKEISDRYITSQGFLKYFPPLTIVLLPRDKDNNTIMTTFESINTTENNDDSMKEHILKKWKTEYSINCNEDELANISKSAIITTYSDGLYLVEVFPDVGYSLLVWDEERYFAIVIDGQHRLEALKYAEQKNKSVSSYYQDVVFLDVASKSIERNESPIKVVRKIFVDINSNAKPVSLVRQFIMDDKDLASLFVQALVNDFDEDGSREGKFLKPQLVDWHTMNLKHELPHLTSILILYQIMSDTMLNKKNLIKIDDLRNRNKVKGWKDRLRDRFLVDEYIKTYNEYSSFKTLSQSWEEYNELLKNAKDDEDFDESDLESMIFEYDYNILSIAQEVFSKVYVSSFVKLFNELKPYRECIEILEKNNVFNTKCIINRALVKSKNRLTPAEKEAIKELKEKLDKEINRKYELFFTVLGQKTLFKLFIEEIDRSIGNTITEEKVLEITEKFISNLNKMFDIMNKLDVNIFNLEKRNIMSGKYIKGLKEYGVLATSFLELIIYRDNNLIYNSRGINALTKLIKYILEFIKLNENNEDKQNYTPPTTNKFEDIAYLEASLKKKIESDFPDKTEDAEKIAESIINAKRNFLNESLLKTLTK